MGLMGGVDKADMERIDEARRTERRMLETISEVAKRAKGVTTRTLDTTGEELLRPYAELSEEAKDLDRGSVRAVIDGAALAGYAFVAGGVARDARHAPVLGDCFPPPLPAAMPTYPQREGGGAGVERRDQQPAGSAAWHRVAGRQFTGSGGVGQYRRAGRGSDQGRRCRGVRL